MLVGVHRVVPPPRLNHLTHLLLVVTMSADQLKAIQDSGRADQLPKLIPQPVQVGDDRLQEIRFCKVGGVFQLTTSRTSHKPRPGRYNENRVRAASLNQPFLLFKRIFESSLRCDHKGPLDMESVISFD